MFYLTNNLRHGSHGAVDAPGTGLPEQKGKNAQYGGSHHDAVKTKSELRHPGRYVAAVSPMPGQFEHPEQGNGLFQVFHTAEYEPGCVQHVAEHEHEKEEETVTESFGTQPGRYIAPVGQAQPAAQQREQLTSAAVAVAIGFVPAGQRHN